MNSLRQSPLGTGDGEGSLQAPFNASKVIARVRVRNLSAIRKREHIIEPVSWLRGGEEHYDELAKAGKLPGTSSIESLHRMAAHGREASITNYEIAPVDVLVTFDSGQYVIPHTDPKTGEEAPWIEVPDGVYDLYVGNYQRLKDPMERAKEIERVKNRRRDLVVREGDKDKNKWAFLEFSYEEIKPIAVAVDAERIYAGEVVEV